MYVELISGFVRMCRDGVDTDNEWRLVIAGLADDVGYTAELSVLVARLHLQDRVIFTGAVPRAEIARLLGGVLAMVYNSICESFGLPLLEAMAAGVAVACSRLSAMIEVAGDAALTFDARSPAEIAAVLVQLRDPKVRTSLIARGQNRITHFGSWADAADQTRFVLLKAVQTYA